MKAVETIKDRIDKYEQQAQKSGALDGKNDEERVRLIKVMEKVVGELQSDDIVVSGPRPLGFNTTMAASVSESREPLFL
eukprot:906504-Prorocentrum_minimum.AAC.1